MKKFINKIKAYIESKRSIYKSKRQIEEMFDAFDYFDRKLYQSYQKPYFYSHFVSMFPEVGTFNCFMSEVCASLQFIFEYMDRTRTDWKKIVEVKGGNFIFDGKSVRFLADMSNIEDYSHDFYFTIDDITSIIDPNVSIKYGDEEFNGLNGCCIVEWERMVFRIMGSMIADALASIYVEHRDRRREKEK